MPPIQAPRILFILKRREDYNHAKHSSHLGLSTGLFNSANFVNGMLTEIGYTSKMVVVHDNNDIDRECTAFRPTHVIIEALWVVPTKFSVLEKLHPSVTWIIRLHSEMPFMAGEGMAMDWLGDYSSFKNTIIAINAPRMLSEIKLYLKVKNKWDDATANRRVIYFPNYYPKDFAKSRTINTDSDTINIGCFGAIRLLKNHLLQAFGALKFADSIGKKLCFHVNAGRIEMKGEPVINNLRGLFEQLDGTGHTLVNHEWVPHDGFIDLCKKMDIGMQATFSETFNIVGADFIANGIPLVGTSEIPWISKISAADPMSSDDLAAKLAVAYQYTDTVVKMNQQSLAKYSDTTHWIWDKYFTNWSIYHERHRAQST
jgi:hypothetical protein